MTHNEAKIQFERLFSEKMSFDEAREFLADLFKRGENADEIAAAAEVMRAHAVPLPIAPDLEEKLIDIVGTGGDKSYSFNISSTVSLLLCAAGAYVAKHGNRSITSKSGSADVLEALGISLELLPAQQVKLLEETGFVFMFAQKHHPAMKHIMPVRKSLDHRTIFNILGPLTNPAGVKKQFIGVYDPALAPMLAEVLQKTGSVAAAVGCGDGNVDELTLSGPSQVAELSSRSIKRYEIIPENLGLKKAPVEALRGGDAAHNAQITYAVFKNQATDAQRNVVLLNAAMALKVEGMARDLKEGLEIASDTLRSGKALGKLEQIAAVSSKL